METIVIVALIALILLVLYNISKNTIDNNHAQQRYYEEKADPSLWAARLLSKDDWVILDTETTGIDDHAQVVEIGVIDASGNVLMAQLIRPIGISRMPSGAKKVHGIGIPDLKNMPTFAEIAEDFMAIVKDKRVIVYNAEYDKRLLYQTAKANNLAIGLPHFECAMKHYATFVGEWNSYRKDYKWHKLPGATHGAIGDCRAVLNVIRKMADGNNK